MILLFYSTFFVLSLNIITECQRFPLDIAEKSPTCNIFRIKCTIFHIKCTIFSCCYWFYMGPVSQVVNADNLPFPSSVCSHISYV